MLAPRQPWARLARRCAMVALVSFIAAAASATADEIHFAIDNNAWDGHANLGVYAPSSGAVIDYEIYVSIEDVELDGRDSQGLAGFNGDLLTNTGITQPLPDFAPVQENTIYYYTIVDNTVFVGMTAYAMGFGMGFLESTGDNTLEAGNILGAEAFMAPDWRANFYAGVPSGQTEIGYATPADSNFGDLAVVYGDVRAKWYLLRGQTTVPDAPGTYTVEFMPDTIELIRNDADLNQDIFTGYMEDGALNNTITSSGFSFTVTPEPATASLLLAGLAIATFRRRQR